MLPRSLLGNSGLLCLNSANTHPPQEPLTQAGGPRWEGGATSAGRPALAATSESVPLRMKTVAIPRSSLKPHSSLKCGRDSLARVAKEIEPKSTPESRSKEFTSVHEKWAHGASQSSHGVRMGTLCHPQLLCHLLRKGTWLQQ